MSSVSLIEELKRLPDFRAAKGRRYDLWLILLLIVMGTMSGCQGYAALEDFGVRHYSALCEELDLEVKRLPSDTTFRRILERLNFQVLITHFERWAMQYTDMKPAD
ncbi:MAG: transposase family protein, partial [Cyanothece sp. SIO1E1]|nr:transposase family protein [Cyanothece sp. SIO1E1]